MSGPAERKGILNRPLAAPLGLASLDAFVIAGAVALAYWMRFEGEVPARFAATAPWMMGGALAAYLAALAAMRLYSHVWRHAGADVLIKMTAAVAAATAVLGGLDVALPRTGALAGVRIAPLGVIVATGVLVFLGCSALRLLSRTVAYVQARTPAADARRVLIVGAGDAGSLLLRDVDNQPELKWRVVGFLDDDPAKAGRLIRGVRVLGPISALAATVERERVDEVFVAMPGASQDARRVVVDECARIGVRTRVVRLFAGEAETVGVADLSAVTVEDLLGREPVEIDTAGIAGTIAGKRVLVTGAAGSIGSELARQVLALGPSALTLADVDESRLYELYLELRRGGSEAPAMRICDVRDLDKTARVIAETAPDVVFHAAAYKHVPLMEIEPDEAVRANVLGTRNVIRACEQAGVGHFVLISTDKAVDPTSVMGATKAIAELLAFDAAARGRLRVSAVRFGNVLASRGSVVPLFERQLREGGPITVTHPEVTRYFMTIPEAARLVLQAQAINRGGDLFVLEMGEPVPIVDLARKMIALSGAHAEIVFTGLRPAEKLHEVLVHDEGGLAPTGHEKVLRADAPPAPPAGLDAAVDALVDAARAGDADAVRAALAGVAPGYAPERAGE
ncbi:MAG: polysaccharide biosynthesis protein [Actinobacteria bacterium]|nr:MAG: polysaccharide biosynthesis protein [Actinomycetota bacterium]